MDLFCSGICTCGRPAFGFHYLIFDCEYMDLNDDAWKRKEKEKGGVLGDDWSTHKPPCTIFFQRNMDEVMIYIWNLLLGREGFTYVLSLSFFFSLFTNHLYNSSHLTSMMTTTKEIDARNTKIRR